MRPKVTIQSKVADALKHYPNKQMSFGDIRNIPWVSGLSKRTLSNAVLGLVQQGKVKRECVYKNNRHVHLYTIIATTKTKHQ
jgi:predicted transcriptional regulator